MKHFDQVTHLSTILIFDVFLGMSETISAWTWPDIETIDAVSATLKDRIKKIRY